MDYIILCVLIIMLVIFPFYFIFNYKLFSPSIITCLGYVASILLAYVGLSSWNNQESLNNSIYIIIILGLMAFCFGELLSKISLTKKNNDKKRTVEKYNIRGIISINRLKYICSILFYIITILLIIKDLRGICSSFSCGASDLTGIVSFYRSKSSLFSSDFVSFSSLTLQLIKICNMITMIYLYSFINNIIEEKRYKNNFYLLIPVFLCFFMGFLQSGRAYILKYMVSAFIIYSILLGKKNNNLGRKNDIKVFKKVLLALIIIMPLFYLAIPLFGRNTDSSFIDYISFYFGCPVPSLNVFLNSNTIVHSDFIGEHTFLSLYRFLAKIHLVDFNIRTSLDFIKFGGLASNVYTSFYRGYIDFNLPITLILSSISGFTYGKMYKLSNEKNNIKYLLFYAYYSANFVDMFRDDSFFSIFLSSTTVSYLIVLNIVVWFYLKKYRLGDSSD